MTVWRLVPASNPAEGSRHGVRSMELTTLLVCVALLGQSGQSGFPPEQKTVEFPAPAELPPPDKVVDLKYRPKIGDRAVLAYAFRATMLDQKSSGWPFKATVFSSLDDLRYLHYLLANPGLTEGKSNPRKLNPTEFEVGTEVLVLKLFDIEVDGKDGKLVWRVGQVRVQ